MRAVSVGLCCTMLLSSHALRSQAPPQVAGGWLGPFSHGSHLVTGSLCPVQDPTAMPPQEHQNDGLRFYPVHAAVIPHQPNKVLVWDRSSHLTCSRVNGDREQRWAIIDCSTPTNPTIQKFSWLIEVGQMPPQPSPANCTNAGHQGLFCAGQCWLPDGRLFVVGGDYWDAPGCTGVGRQSNVFDATFPQIVTPSFAGSALVCIFDPALLATTAVPNTMQATNATAGGTPGGSPWKTLPLPQQLRHPRWYPTVTLLPPVSTAPNSMRIGVAGGLLFSDGGNVPYAPAVGATVTDQSFDSYEMCTQST